MPWPSQRPHPITTRQAPLILNFFTLELHINWLILLILFYVWLLKTALLRYNPHTTQCTQLKCTTRIVFSIFTNVCVCTCVCVCGFFAQHSVFKIQSVACNSSSCLCIFCLHRNQNINCVQCLNEQDSWIRHNSCCSLKSFLRNCFSLLLGWNSSVHPVTYSGHCHIPKCLRSLSVTRLLSSGNARVHLSVII